MLRARFKPERRRRSRSRAGARSCGLPGRQGRTGCRRCARPARPAPSPGVACGADPRGRDCNSTGHPPRVLV